MVRVTLSCVLEDLKLVMESLVQMENYKNYKKIIKVLNTDMQNGQ